MPPLSIRSSNTPVDLRGCKVYAVISDGKSVVYNKRLRIEVNSTVRPALPAKYAKWPNSFEIQVHYPDGTIEVASRGKFQRPLERNNL